MNQLNVLGKQKIGNFEFVAIEGGFGKGRKAMTAKDIAGIHKREVKVINQAVNMNINRFIEGVDIIDLKSVVNQIDLEQFGFTQNAINRSNNIYILSERGYAKLLKILEDDTAWEIYDELVDKYFSYRKVVQEQQATLDSETKRMNAEARLKNANSRQAKLLADLASDTSSEVNKALLQDKAVEVITGEKLLEMPKLPGKFYTAREIAKKLGVLSKAGNPHETAISQLIKEYIDIREDESEEFPESKDGWSGAVTKYTESVIDKVSDYLNEIYYPAVLNISGKNYSVVYQYPRTKKYTL